MLSQIERGRANPSFRTLFKIARALDASVSSFVVGIEGEDGGMLVRSNERKKLILPISESGSPDSGLVYELLCPNLSGRLEMIWIEYAPGVSTHETPFAHQGEECGVLLHGIMEAHVGDSCLVLKSGDSIYLKSHVPHWFRNPGRRRASMVWAITPPSF
jgi:mannose-6-phosphate isomerase-like protein (cupin superfamily)